MKNTKGQVMVEMALCIPLMLLMLKGAVDLGNMAYTKHRLVAAAYEGTKIISQATGPFDLISCSQDVTPKDTSEDHEGRRALQKMDGSKSKSTDASDGGEKAPKIPVFTTICDKMKSRTTLALTNAGLDPSKNPPASVYKLVKKDGTPGNDFLLGGIAIDYTFGHFFASITDAAESKFHVEVFTHVAPLINGNPNNPYEKGKKCIDQGGSKDTPRQCF